MINDYIIRFLFLAFIAMSYSYFDVLIKYKKCNEELKNIKNFILTKKISKYLLIFAVIIVILILVIDLFFN